MDRWAGRVALVTGASAGIGAAICRQLVDAGMVVIGAARSVERIEALSKELKEKPGTLVGVKCDLTKDADIENLFSVIKKEYKGVDVCINNAGMSHNHSLLEGTTKEWREMLDINVVSLCLCTKEAVKSMQERGVDDGHIVHAISPGVVETEFSIRMRGEKAGKEMYKTLPCITAYDVATSVCHILAAPPHVQIHDLIIRPTAENF